MVGDAVLGPVFDMLQAWAKPPHIVARAKVRTGLYTVDPAA